MIVLILTYINFLPIPWRFAILVDAWGDACAKEVEPPGLDFYGRPTEALWFHIDRHQRAVIAFFLNIACWLHIVSVGFQCYYWPYIETQTWPGVFAINVPGGLSIVSVVTAGVLQVIPYSPSVSRISPPHHPYPTPSYRLRRHRRRAAGSRREEADQAAAGAFPARRRKVHQGGVERVAIGRIGNGTPPSPDRGPASTTPDGTAPKRAVRTHRPTAHRPPTAPRFRARACLTRRGRAPCRA